MWLTGTLAVHAQFAHPWSQDLITMKSFRNNKVWMIYLFNGHVYIQAYVYERKGNANIG